MSKKEFTWEDVRSRSDLYKLKRRKKTREEMLKYAYDTMAIDCKNLRKDKYEYRFK